MSKVVVLVSVSLLMVLMEVCRLAASPRIPRDLIGTTAGRRIGSCALSGCGVVFKLDVAGNETVLYSFTVGQMARCPGQICCLTPREIYTGLRISVSRKARREAGVSRPGWIPAAERWCFDAISDYPAGNASLLGGGTNEYERKTKFAGAGRRTNNASRVLPNVKERAL